MTIKPEVLAAIDKMRVALNDWTVCYAADLCDDEDVKAAQERMRTSGVLLYICEAQAAVDRVRAELLAMDAEVADLRADRDCWEDQANERVKDWNDMRIRAEKLEEADALLRDTLHQWPSLGCDAFHHRKSDQHSVVEECEPLRRWRALYAAIQDHLSENAMHNSAQEVGE
jgi:hypothetical protein